MAKKTGRRKSTTSDKSSRTFRKEIAGWLLMVLGAVTLLALLGFARGVTGDAWTLFLRRIFGWGAWVVALAAILGGGLLLFRRELLETRSLWRLVLGLEGMLILGLGLTHIQAGEADPLALAQAGDGGGFVGWAVGHILEKYIGRSTAMALLALGLLGLLGVVLAPYRMRIGGVMRRGVVGLDQVLSDQMEGQEQPSGASFQEVAPVLAPEPTLPETKRRGRKPKPKEAPSTPSKPRSRKRTRTGRRDRRLPSIELFEEDTAAGIDTAGIRYRSQIIEETLASFGVPVRVTEVRQGPAITQFGVEPGFVEHAGRNGTREKRRVRVSKISTLANDLALALAASPIRIEAPVPGRSVVGIEVPNTEISLVGLRGVLESPSYGRVKSQLRVALGRDVAGEPTVVDLAAMPHLLIAGATGSGKSVCINSVIACLLYNCLPADLKLLLIDPKRVELTNYNGIPHLLAPAIVEVDEVVGALRWVTREMDRRYKLFSKAGKRNLHTYNRSISAGDAATALPYIVVVIDELADLMLVSPDEVERSVCRIAQMARATGIHLVMATQRPSVDVVTGLIKANFPARISFAVTSQVDSRVVLDAPGAEKLLGRGDMLFMAPDSSKLVRLQGCFVSDDELDRLVDFWRGSSGALSVESETPPWEQASFLAEESDELLESAIELVREHEQASTSWLQRQLRIGYPRAARIMDTMEELGIIGPAESGGRGRQVIVADGNEAEDDISSDGDAGAADDSHDPALGDSASPS